MGAVASLQERSIPVLKRAASDSDVTATLAEVA